MAGPRVVYCVHERPMHAPLALGCLVSYARAYRGGVLNERFRFDPLLYFSASRVVRAMRSRGPGILLFPHYEWNTREWLRISAAVKAAIPDCITVHGGPSVPRFDYACEEFLAEHPHVDVAVRGEGEATLAELLERLSEVDRRDDWGSALSSVAGIAFRPDPKDRRRVVRTAERPSIQDLESIPSPYTGGFFDASGDVDWIAAVMETTRGCPYGCTFCDWGQYTSQSVRRFSLERIAAELEWIARKRIDVIWVADANFGILPRDVEVAELLAKSKERYGYPKQIAVNYAKNSTMRLAEIIRILNRARVGAEGIVSLQTTDPQTLRTVRRDNIKPEPYLALLEVFREERLPVATDLLIGLPGSTYESFKVDLQFCFDRRVHAKAYATQVLPNAPMAHRDYVAANEIRTDDEKFVVSTKTASAEEIRRIGLLYDLYLVFVEFGILKYVLYFVQEEHGVRALDVLEALGKAVDAGRRDLPQAAKVRRSFGFQESARRGYINYRPKMLFVAWRAFYREIARYLTTDFGIPADEELATVLAAQECVMPRLGGLYPKTVGLRHDVVAYFRRSAGDTRRLREFAPRSLVVSDPLRMCWLPMTVLFQYDHHKVHFELTSEMMFDMSSDRFLFLPDKISATEIARVTIPRYAKLAVKGARNRFDSGVNGALARRALPVSG